MIGHRGRVLRTCLIARAAEDRTGLPYDRSNNSGFVLLGYISMRRYRLKTRSADYAYSGDHSDRSR